MKHVILLILFQITLCSNSYSEPDSLLVVWNNTTLSAPIRYNALHKHYAKFVKSGNLDTVNHYSAFEIEYGRRKKIDSVLARAYHMKGLTFYFSKQQDSAINYLEQALFLYQKTNRENKLGNLYSTLGSLYFDMRRTKTSFDYQLEAVKIYEKLGDKEKIAKAYNNLSLAYLKVLDPQTALMYMKKASAFFKEQDNLFLVAHIDINISLTLLDLGKYKKAEEHSHKAIHYLIGDNDDYQKVLNQKPNYSHIIARAYGSLGECYFEQRKIELALENVKKSISIFKKYHPEDVSLVEGYCLVGLCFQETNDTDSALYYGTKALNFAKEYSSQQAMPLRATELLYKIYKNRKNYQKSLEMLEITKERSDSMYSDEKRLLALRDHIEYEYDKELIQKEAEFLKEKLIIENEASKKRYAITFTGILIILTLLSILQFRSMKSKAERSELILKLEEMKKKNISLASKGNSENPKIDWDKIHALTENKLNQTDISIINTLYANPHFSNQDIAKKIFLTSDGVNSALKKMYRLFDISGRNKRISMIMYIIQESE